MYHFQHWKYFKILESLRKVLLFSFVTFGYLHFLHFCCPTFISRRFLKVRRIFRRKIWAKSVLGTSLNCYAKKATWGQERKVAAKNQRPCYVLDYIFKIQWLKYKQYHTNAKLGLVKVKGLFCKNLGLKKIGQNEYLSLTTLKGLFRFWVL